MSPRAILKSTQMNRAGHQKVIIINGKAYAARSTVGQPKTKGTASSGINTRPAGEIARPSRKWKNKSFRYTKLKNADIHNK